ncbi:proteasome ATPase [Kocuria coralli]|uniref:AAA ATPase forming ring-shaped complexes n=1 Tax=Kocuria coralli TaxID=1461025 RepID=A0A5J5KUD9_9MICC|nr:proteasome ATPase [Kocuria coralli]KAA9393337.1 proteasome ATPase [Kocuria coralli]
MTGTPSSSSPSSAGPGGSGDDQRAQQLATAHRQVVAIVREEKRALDRQLATAGQQNQKLRTALEGARDQITKLKKALEHDLELPLSVGTLIRVVAAGDSPGTTSVSADAMLAGRSVRCPISPLVPRGSLEPGCQILVDEHSVVVAALGYEATGELASVREVVDGSRLVTVGRSDEERVLRMSGALRENPPQPGQTVSIDHRTGFALEVVQRTGMEELVLEEVPNVRYEDIGGLREEIEQIQDAVELPFVHPDLYRQHRLTPPKGILLYGPPGNGKTMIAKAVARSLAERAAEKSGREQAKGYFLNIKGPELLDKYVGETERQIRQIFSRAREQAEAGIPVVVFFDEMDSLFRTRGSGVSSDVETTIVPQLLTEIDGVEKLDNVIIVGATNREDMIDPAVLRPGRLDVKIRIDRPDATGAREIFALYLTPDLPLHQEEVIAAGSRESAVDALIDSGVRAMYAQTDATRFLEITYKDGERETLWFSDFVSGAVIRNIVDRAKKQAIKDLLTRGVRGITREHIRSAVAQEFMEQQDLPDTSDPDDWARISGRRGDTIADLRIVMHRGPRPGDATGALPVVAPPADGTSSDDDGAGS